MKAEIPNRKAKKNRRRIRKVTGRFSEGPKVINQNIFNPLSRSLRDFRSGKDSKTTGRSGAYGSVIKMFEAKTKDDETPFAIKMMDLVYTEEYEKELQAFKLLKGRVNIMPLIMAFTDHDAIKRCLVMPYHRWNLHEALKNRCLTEAKNWEETIIRQVIRGVASIQAVGLIHRDLKPKNIMLTEFNRVLITDFGTAVKFRKDQKFSILCGTPPYRAPEMIHKKLKGGYGHEVDWWSVGFIIHEVLTNHVPYDTELYSIQEYERMSALLDPVLGANLSRERARFILRFLNKNPKERLGAKGLEEITEDPYFIEIQERTDPYHGAARYEREKVIRRAEIGWEKAKEKAKETAKEEELRKTN